MLDQNWSRIEGPVTLKTLSGQRIAYASLTAFVRQHRAHWIKSYLTDDTGRVAQLRNDYYYLDRITSADRSLPDPLYSRCAVYDIHDLIIPVWRILEHQNQIGGSEKTRPEYDLDRLERWGWRYHRHFRNGVVPYTGHSGGWRGYRRIRTSQEHRLAFDEPDREDYGLRVGPRAKRMSALPTDREAHYAHHERSWKRHRCFQSKNRS